MRHGRVIGQPPAAAVDILINAYIMGCDIILLIISIIIIIVITVIAIVIIIIAVIVFIIIVVIIMLLVWLLLTFVFFRSCFSSSEFYKSICFQQYSVSRDVCVCVGLRPIKNRRPFSICLYYISYSLRAFVSVLLCYQLS